MPTAKLTDADNGVPGGRYTAVDLGNGTFNILDVPIMYEIPRSVFNTAEDISETWMRTAVAKAAKLRDGGYLPPLHVNHHNDGRQVEPAGKFCPRRVAKKAHMGEEKWCVFADLLEIPAKIYNEIKGRFLPYRSPEFPLKRAPEITSLALMRDEPPHCKFELLTVGREIKAKPADVVKLDAMPALAMLSDGDRAAALFKFDAVKLADKDGEDGKPAEGNGDSKPEDKKPEGAAKGPDAAYLKCLRALHKNMVSMAEKIGHPVFDEEAFAQLAEVTDAEPPPGKENNSGHKPVDQPSDGAMRSKLSDKENAMPDANEINVKLTEQAAEIAALKSAGRARDRRDAVAKLVEAAEKKLAGWHIDADVRAELAQLADSDESGKLLDVYVNRYQKAVPKDPMSRASAAGEPSTAQDAPEVAKLSHLGPEKLEMARKISKDYDAAVEHGIPIGMTRERFLALNLKS